MQQQLRVRRGMRMQGGEGGGPQQEQLPQGVWEWRRLVRLEQHPRPVVGHLHETQMRHPPSHQHQQHQQHQQQCLVWRRHPLHPPPLSLIRRPRLVAGALQTRTAPQACSPLLQQDQRLHEGQRANETHSCLLQQEAHRVQRQHELLTGWLQQTLSQASRSHELQQQQSLRQRLVSRCACAATGAASVTRARQEQQGVVEAGP